MKDPNDLQYANFGLNNALAARGDATVTPEWEAELNGTLLTEGKHYTVAYYDGYPEEGGALVEAPLGIGSYYAVFTAVSDVYSGSYGCWFEVSDATNLEQARFDLDRFTYVSTGEPVELWTELPDWFRDALSKLGPPLE